MPRLRFQWTNLSPELLYQLATTLKLAGDPAEALKEQYGARPKPEFIQDAWSILLETWLSNDFVFARQIAAALKDRGLGDAAIEDEIMYLKSCRNTIRLRNAAIDAFIALGEREIHPSEEVLKASALPRVQRLAGPELLAMIAATGEVEKSELVRATGYVYVKADGIESLLFAEFYEAVLEAKGLSVEDFEAETEIGTWIAANQVDGLPVSWADVPEDLIKTVDDISRLVDILSEKDQVFLFNSLSPSLALLYRLSYGLLDEAEEVVAALKGLREDEWQPVLSSAIQNCDKETIEGLNAKSGDIRPRILSLWLKSLASRIGTFSEKIDFAGLAVLHTLGIDLGPKKQSLVEQIIFDAFDKFAIKITADEAWGCLSQSLDVYLLPRKNDYGLAELISSRSPREWFCWLFATHNSLISFGDRLDQLSNDDSEWLRYVKNLRRDGRLFNAFFEWAEFAFADDTSWRVKNISAMAVSTSLGFSSSMFSDKEEWERCFSGCTVFDEAMKEEVRVAFQNPDELEWQLTSAYELTTLWQVLKQEQTSWQSMTGDDLLGHLDILGCDEDIDGILTGITLLSIDCETRDRINSEVKQAYYLSDRPQKRFNQWVDDVCDANSSWASILAGSEVYSYALELNTILDDKEGWEVYFQDCSAYPGDVREELVAALGRGDLSTAISSWTDESWKNTIAFGLVRDWMRYRVLQIDWGLTSGGDLFAMLDAINNSEFELVLGQISDSVLIPEYRKEKLAIEYSLAYNEAYD